MRLSRSMSGVIGWKNETEDRCNALLVEFLQARSSSIAQGTGKARSSSIASKNSETVVVIHSQVTLLSDDLLFKIFMLVPAESLCRIQFVCKKWFSLITSSVFLRCHTQQQEAEKVLICRKLAFSPQPSEDQPKRYFHLLDLNRMDDDFIESSVVDLEEILSSCDGLVLGRIRKCLILVNPVTRMHIKLPLGTTTYFPGESYNLVYCKEAKTYTVVHLFHNNPEDKDCEILGVHRRTWKQITGFSILTLLKRDSMQKAISIDGSLYWLTTNNSHCCYIVTMNVQDEKFMTKALPEYFSLDDRLIEIGGVLGFVAHATSHLMHVWILKNNEDGSIDQAWIRSCSINLDLNCCSYPTPICSQRIGKELVFTYPGIDQLYVYDCDEGEMKLVYSRGQNELWPGSMEDLYFPHKNTLVSWNK